jgi:hypothetical protein
MRASMRAPVTPHVIFMLRPVFEQLGIRWHKPPIGVLPVIFLLMIAWILAFFLLPH